MIDFLTIFVFSGIGLTLGVAAIIAYALVDFVKRRNNRKAAICIWYLLLVPVFFFAIGDAIYVSNFGDQNFIGISGFLDPFWVFYWLIGAYFLFKPMEHKFVDSGIGAIHGSKEG